MDSNTMGTVAAVAAAGAVAAALMSFLSWRLQRINFAENQQYKERLKLEEHYFKLHLLWQELRIAAGILQSLPPASAEFAPQVGGLPIEQITEAMATRDLLGADAATKVRIARDDLVELGQVAADARSAEARKLMGFEKRFPDLLMKTLSSIDEAREAIINQLQT